MFATLSRPRRIATTGDDTPARTIWGYVQRMTGRSQALACVLAVIATALSLAPIELQRRLFDDALSQGDLDLLAWLGLAYLAVICLHQVVKFALGMVAGWMSESAVVYTRAHLWRLSDDAAQGDKNSILLTEADALGAFAGGAPSQFVANLTMLVGALAYMFWVEPVVAMAGLALVAPQAILAPYLQKRLNRLVDVRLRLIRRYAGAIDREPSPSDEEMAAKLKVLHRARMAFLFWKFALKSTLNLLNAAAPLGVIVIGGWQVIENETTVGVVVAFVGGFARLGDPVRKLIGFYRESQEASVRHELIASWMKDRAKS